MAFLLYRACNAPILRVSVLKKLIHTPVIRVSAFKKIPHKQIFRTFADQKPKRSLMDYLMAPTTEIPFNVGKIGVAIAGLSFIGSLCYYEAGLYDIPGAVDKYPLWPQYVKDRIQLTYLFFVTAITITAVFAGLTFHCQDIMIYVANNTYISFAISMSAIVGTGLVTQKLPYYPEFGMKHLMWMSHCAVTGCVLAPMAHVGGKIWIQASAIAWCIVAALAAVAITAPSEKFLLERGPLSMGIAIVLTSAFGTWSFPHGTAFGAITYSIFLYGGLMVFMGFLLHDTQRIIQRAETFAQDPGPGERVFDPINSGMEMYMDVFNIFFRVLAMIDLEDLMDNFVEIVVGKK